MNPSMNTFCFVLFLFFSHCYAAKIHGSKRMLPVPEKHELRKLIQQNNGNQHWVETPKIVEDDIENRKIVKRQSSLTLAEAITNTAALETAVINKHNDLRSSEALQENAALMEKMSGNSDLANFAKSVTNTCYFDHSTNLARSNKFGFTYFGENLAVTTAGSSTPESQIQSWFNEKSDYDFNTNSCTLGKMCGHYTQIVWGTSKYIGCAVTFCPVMSFPNGQTWPNAYFFACNYGPGGNYIGQRPYTKSTTCADCGHTCIQGLCDENAVATTTTSAATAAPTITSSAAATTSTAVPTTTPAAATTTTLAAATTTTPVAATTTTPAATTTTDIVTGVPTIPGCINMDINQYCAYYDTYYAICSGTNNYLDFAIDNCKGTCNFCECRDFVNTCSSYDSIYSVCTWGTQNYWYGFRYCKKTCGIC